MRPSPCSGLCSHYGLVALPEQYRAFDHPAVIGVALTLYVVEFVADKIPWFDSMWDAVHTLIRPLGGALVAVVAMGDASPAATALVGLLGGSIAMTTHVTKAGTRAAANTSPEPFSNWVLSFGEDVLAVGITYGALAHPLIALGDRARTAGGDRAVGVDHRSSDTRAVQAGVEGAGAEVTERTEI